MIACKACGGVYKLGVVAGPPCFMFRDGPGREGKPFISVNCPNCTASSKDYKTRAEAEWAWDGGEQISRAARLAVYHATPPNTQIGKGEG